MRFRDIPKFPHCIYRITLPWTHIEDHIADSLNVPAGIAPLDLEPDFQRGHVWTELQQIRFVEYMLRGGTSGKDLYFNCPGWNHGFSGPYVIVDGKQRLQAVRRFMANEIAAFGYRLSEYDDKLTFAGSHFNWHVAALETRAEVLQWYLDFNSSGTPHSAKEIERVRALLAAAK